MHNALVRSGYAIASIGSLLALWQITVDLGGITPFILPPPALVLEGFWQIMSGYMGGTVFTHIAASMKVMLTGYAVAIAVGVPLGIAMATWRPVEIVFQPLLTVLRPIPPPAWIPLAILWLGIDLAGKVFIVVIAAMVPCLINSYLAVKQTPRELIDAARTLGAGRRTMLLEVVVPSGLPVLLTGLRIALGNAWATIVAAELVVATAGLGFLMMNGYRNFESHIMAGSMIAIGLIGFLMNVAFQRLERHLVSWEEPRD
jgi:ABC-type nitrate/sulfonate/bicarbonate transport system permease component